MSNYEEGDMDLIALSEDTARLSKLLYVKLTAYPEARQEAARKLSGTVRIALPGDIEMRALATKG